MKARDSKTVNPLKSLLSAHHAAVKEATLKNPGTHFESNVFFFPLVQRQISKRKDSLREFKEHNRLDLAEKEQHEISVLEKYIPQPQTTAEQVARMTREAVKELRESGWGNNDPGNMSPRRILECMNSIPERKRMLGELYCEQGMLRRVMAETIRDLSDRIDGSPKENVELLKPRKVDHLTKPRIQ
jgi:uncharacterized protein YqeY